MVEYREKFYVGSDELEKDIPKEPTQVRSNLVAIISAIVLLLLLLRLMELTIQ